MEYFKTGGKELIETVEVVRQSDRCVWVKKGHLTNRQAKKGHFVNYFEHKFMAKEFLLNKYYNRLADKNKEAQAIQDTINEVHGL